ncbi:MAG TPA: SAM-dependent methyltransferase [Chryseolinea sp.]|jgi:16S rRNA (cytidine1402-2'-O)-methyltransferase|nr:SAM-dependent methyltransferase [Chryseolinea sp.]
MEKGKLYLIPNVIADNTQAVVISSHISNALHGIRHFFAEDIRTARRYLSSLRIYPSIEELHFQLLNKDSKPEDLPPMFEPIYQGLNVGIISESGCPGIADPGSLAVRFAHENQVQVIPLVGPSSILLALMASGLNGQKFTFHGYLPIDAKECASVIRDLEKESKQRNQTQIFIETPYRNNHLKDLLVKNLKNETALCIATDITGIEENIQTLTVKNWKQVVIDMPKAPTVFLFLSF